MRQASILQPRDFDRCRNKYSKGHGHPPAGRRGGTPSPPALARSALARAALATGVAGSLALLPLAWAQGSVTRRRVPLLPPAKPPYHGWVPGIGEAIRVLAIGESTVSGVGLSRSDETVAATTAQALVRLTGRPAAWRACGLTGATVRDGLHELVPRIVPTPADLIILAFCVNDVTAYRSPAVFAKDLAALVTAARNRVGNAAVVVGGVAPLDSFRRCHGRWAPSSAGARPRCRRRPSD